MSRQLARSAAAPAGWGGVQARAAAHDSPDREYPISPPRDALRDIRLNEVPSGASAVTGCCFGSCVFDMAPGEVAVGMVADTCRRGRIQVDVGVFGAGRAGAPGPRAVSQETTEVQGHESPSHLEWGTPVRELLAVKGDACGADETHSLVTAGGP